MTASLSYADRFGPYGLRVEPTYDQMLNSVRKPLKIPLPDRSSKWYATGPYRALILDANEAYNTHQQNVIDYRQSGAVPPEKAAQVRPSETGADARWQSYYDYNTALDEEHAYNDAADTMRAQEREQTNQLRRQVLSSSSGPNQINPTVEAHHPDLEGAGVPHDMPAPRATRSSPYPYPAPYDEYAADGHPRAPASAPSNGSI